MLLCVCKANSCNSEHAINTEHGWYSKSLVTEQRASFKLFGSSKTVFDKLDPRV
jgi:hypothetical protein